MYWFDYARGFFPEITRVEDMITYHSTPFLKFIKRLVSTRLQTNGAVPKMQTNLADFELPKCKFMKECELILSIYEHAAELCA